MIGHFRDDTMWPWNDVIGLPRPPAAPGEPFTAPAYPANLVPPTPGACVDYLGMRFPMGQMGVVQFAYCYDDVPFGSQP